MGDLVHFRLTKRAKARVEHAVVAPVLELEAARTRHRLSRPQRQWRRVFRFHLFGRRFELLLST